MLYLNETELYLAKLYIELAVAKVKSDRDSIKRIEEEIKEVSYEL